MRIRHVRAWFTVAFMAAVILPAHAQQYPVKAARVLVGFVAGGPVDVLARELAQSFGSSMGQPFVVENRAGGNAVIAAEVVARAAPDGYSLLVTPEFAMTVNPSGYAKLSYDPMADFAPVSQLVGANFGLAANAQKVPGATLADLIAQAKANPGKVNYGSASTLSQLVVEQLKGAQGLNIVYVPYKGTAQMLPALLAGEVELAIGPAAPYATFVKEGRVRVLVVTGARRDPLLPDTPTLREAGFAQLETQSWLGLFTTAGTPPAVVARLNAEALKALSDSQLRQRIAKVGFYPIAGTPEQLGVVVKTEIARWAPVVKAAGIKFD